MTTANHSRKYITTAGSIPNRVISWLIANPDEELLPIDMAVKFDANTNTVHTQLARAVEVGALERRRSAYKLGSRTTAIEALGMDGHQMRTEAIDATVVAMAAMTTLKPTQPAPEPKSIDDAPGEAWNAAAAVALEAARATDLVLPDGTVLTIEDAPYQSPRSWRNGSPLDKVFDALAASQLKPGQTKRCVLPPSIERKFVTGALQRWHKARGHEARLIEIVLTKRGEGTAAALQRIPVPTAA